MLCICLALLVGLSIYQCEPVDKFLRFGEWEFRIGLQKFVSLYSTRCDTWLFVHLLVINKSVIAIFSHHFLDRWDSLKSLGQLWRRSSLCRYFIAYFGVVVAIANSYMYSR